MPCFDIPGTNLLFSVLFIARFAYISRHVSASVFVFITKPHKIKCCERKGSRDTCNGEDTMGVGGNMKGREHLQDLGVNGR